MANINRIYKPLRNECIALKKTDTSYVASSQNINDKVIVLL